jgi:hypothetical protein
MKGWINLYRARTIAVSRIVSFIKTHPPLTLWSKKVFIEEGLKMESLERMISKAFSGEWKRESKLARLVASSCLQTNWRAGCFEAVILLRHYSILSIFLFPNSTWKKLVLMRQTWKCRKEKTVARVLFFKICESRANGGKNSMAHVEDVEILKHMTRNARSYS